MNRWQLDLQDEVLYEIDELRHRSRYGNRNSKHYVDQPDGLNYSKKRNRPRHAMSDYNNR